MEQKMILFRKAIQKQTDILVQVRNSFEYRFHKPLVQRNLYAQFVTQNTVCDCY